MVKPSQTFNQPWIFSKGVFNSLTSAKKYPHAGKWLLFIPQNEIDTTWEKVNKATVSGLLGINE